MRYAFFYVCAYTFFLTFITFLLSLLGILYIHRLGNIGAFHHGTTEHKGYCSDSFLTLALFALGHFSVLRHRFRWDDPSLNWRLVVSRAHHHVRWVVLGL